MAKDRRIVNEGGVVAGKKVYKPGQEDALAEVLLPDSARQLLEKNELDGDWSDAGEKVLEQQAKAEAKAAGGNK